MRERSENEVRERLYRKLREIIWENEREKSKKEVREKIWDKLRSCAYKLETLFCCRSLKIDIELIIPGMASRLLLKLQSSSNHNECSAQSSGFLDLVKPWDLSLTRCLSTYFLIEILLCYSESVECVEIWIIDIYSLRDVFYPWNLVLCVDLRLKLNMAIACVVNQKVE